MDGWVWSNGGMLLTGETEVLGKKHYSTWVVDGWMSMEQWWNHTDRGHRSAGRKTFYNMGGRWMDEYGAMVECYSQGKTEVLGEKHYTTWVVDGWMSMEQWWNDTDRGNWSAGRKTLYSVGGRWTNQFGGMILIVDNPIPDTRQYPSGTVSTTNSDMYWPGTKPDPSSAWHHSHTTTRLPVALQLHTNMSLSAL